MLFDESTQRYLVQKIAPNPYYNGGLWNTSAGGHVDENETYLDTVLRELAEEMGVYGMHSPREVLRYKTTKTSFRAGDTRTYNRHNVTHLALIDGTSLEMQLGDEVEEAAWFTVVELKSMRDSSAKVMTDALEYFVDQYLH